MTTRPALNAIAGLRWSEHRALDNGGGSSVIPFPRTWPLNLVFHGEQPFSYGHYGIHLGQEDRLTFLGGAQHVVTAKFIDCRDGSPTARRALQVEFSPSAHHELRIPPGVAHNFDGLEGVHTLNNYRIFLPDPERWLLGDIEWNVEADIVNEPADCTPDEVRLVTPNRRCASNVFYGLINDRQRETIGRLRHSHTYTTDYEASDGRTVRLKIEERFTGAEPPASEPIDGIAGLHWINKRYLPSGPLFRFRSAQCAKTLLHRRSWLRALCP